jgi:hypothetical protein
MDREVKSRTSEIILIFIIVIAICGLGIVAISQFGNSYFEQQPSLASNQERRLVARVKGSIYENSEQMSVFGTCVDSYDVPVINSTGTFYAWFPNGTQYLLSQPMTQMAEGYFVWQGAMPIVGGTYLTEFICDGLGQQARAWGEWQNPVWVNRIADILSLTNYSYLLLQDVNGNVVSINATVNEIIDILNNLNISLNWSIVLNAINESTTNIIQNITFLQQTMENDFNQTNQLILDTQVIANASVDRTDSYLAWLLWKIINGTGSPINGSVTWDEYYVDRVAYWHSWTIKIKVYDEYGSIVRSPLAYCTIETNMHPLQYMVSEGDHFTITLFINQLDDLSWITFCSRV